MALGAESKGTESQSTSIGAARRAAHTAEDRMPWPIVACS
jgi:hypothetical protein